MKTKMARHKKQTHDCSRYKKGRRDPLVDGEKKQNPCQVPAQSARPHEGERGRIFERVPQVLCLASLRVDLEALHQTYPKGQGEHDRVRVGVEARIVMHLEGRCRGRYGGVWAINLSVPGSSGLYGPEGE